MADSAAECAPEINMGYVNIRQMVKERRETQES